MADVVRVIPVTGRGNMISFRCPGCNSTHTVPIDHKNGNDCQWSWNGSLDRPTLSPSIVERVGPYEWGPRKGQTTVCHSFVRDGMIQFLSDCTHDKAGQTLAIPAYA